MNLKRFRPILELTALAFSAFVCHLVFFYFFGGERIQYFHYSLLEIYGFFFACAAVIIIVLIKVEQTNIDSVGNTFMLLTCIKLVAAYMLLRPILNSNHKYLSFEKTNFFLIFLLFLTLETVVVIRILNKIK